MRLTNKNQINIEFPPMSLKTGKQDIPVKVNGQDYVLKNAIFGFETGITLQFDDGFDLPGVEWEGK